MPFLFFPTCFRESGREKDYFLSNWNRQTVVISKSLGVSPNFLSVKIDKNKNVLKQKGIKINVSLRVTCQVYWEKEFIVGLVVVAYACSPSGCDAEGRHL